MLTAKLVRLDTAWSATPQPRRRPAWRGGRQNAAVRGALGTAAPSTSLASTTGIRTARGGSAPRPAVDEVTEPPEADGQ